MTLEKQKIKKQTYNFSNKKLHIVDYQSQIEKQWCKTFHYLLQFIEPTQLFLNILNEKFIFKTDQIKDIILNYNIIQAMSMLNSLFSWNILWLVHNYN